MKDIIQRHTVNNLSNAKVDKFKKFLPKYITIINIKDKKFMQISRKK